MMRGGFREAVAAFSKTVSDSEEAKKNLLSIIQMMSGGSPTTPDLPGSRFANLNRELKSKNVDLLFLTLIAQPEYVMKEVDLCTEVFAYVAAWDFKHFVDDFFPVILGNHKMRCAAIRLAALVFDPLSGFMKAVSKGEENLFSNDMTSDFGQALQKMRQMIVTRALQLIENRQGDVDRKIQNAFAVKRVSSSLRKVVIDEFPHAAELSCGYPDLKMMITLSDLVQRDSFALHIVPTDSDNIGEWLSFYSKIMGCEDITDNFEIHFDDYMPVGDDELVATFKLVPLTGIELNLTNEQYRFILNEILGAERARGAFLAVWCQIQIILDSSFRLGFWKALLGCYSGRALLSPDQYYIFLALMGKVLDALSYTGEELITEEDVRLVETIAVIGLCSNEGSCRFSAMKLLDTMTRYGSNMWKVFLESRPDIPSVFMIFFDQNPASYLEPPVVRPERLFDLVAICSNNASHLWQLTLSAMLSIIYESLDSDFIAALKSEALAFLNFKYLHTDFAVNLMTLLACLLNRSDPTTDETIISEIMHRSKAVAAGDMSSLNILIGSVPSSFHEKMILIVEDSFDMRVASTLARIVSWSDQFDANVTPFLEVFFRLTQVMVGRRLLLQDCQFELLPEQTENFGKNLHVILEYCASVYKLCGFFEANHMKEQNECFPCQMIVNDPDNPEIKLFSNLFNALLGFTLFKGSERLVSYSTKALAKYITCVPFMNAEAMSSDAFLAQIDKISGFCPSILQNLLNHHFVSIFPKFLDFALQKNGEKYLNAICSYFRPSNAPPEVDIKRLLIEQQWNNLGPMNSHSQKMEVIYNNTGKLVFCCLFYLARDCAEMKDEAYVLLATLIPLIYIFHMEGRSDKVKSLIDKFFELSAQCVSSTSQKSVTKISGAICEAMPFCLEQVLKAALVNMKNWDNGLVNEVLPVLVPWFEAVEIDTEDRVICRESTLVFIEFSGYSLIESMLKCLQGVFTDDFSSPAYTIWTSLVTKDEKPNNNFMPVLLCLHHIAPRYKEALFRIFRFLFTVEPLSVISVLTSTFKFTYSFFMSQRGETPNAESQLFSVTCLMTLMTDSMENFIQFLPLIFSFAMVYIDVFTDEVINLCRKMIQELKPFIKEDCQVEYAGLCELFTIRSESLDHRAPAVIYDFFEAFDTDSGTEFAMELLRWGVCCADIPRAAAALRAKPMVTSQTIIGLCVRALACVSSAASVSSQRDVYMNYMVSMLAALQSMAEELFLDDSMPPDTALLWTALESLKCPDNNVFANAIAMLDDFLSRKKLFEVLTGDAEFDGTQFQEAVIWKFHAPWNDTYSGFADYLCIRNSIEPYDVTKTIELLCHMVQTRYLTLFRNSEKTVYTVLLLLLPWIWKCKHISMKAGLASKAEVTLAKDTIEAFCALLSSDEDASIKEKLQRQNVYIDLQDDIVFICRECLSLFDSNELPLICHFYTDLVEFGTSTMTRALYYLTYEILTRFPDCSAHLSRFANVMRHDKVVSHKTIIREFMQTYVDSPESSSIDSQFPSFPLYERIVAVTIPHMFEPNITDYQVEQFDDPNTFPPLLPNDPSVLEVDKFSSVAAQLRQIVVAPFEEWHILINKLSMKLVNQDKAALMVANKRDHIKEIDVQAIFNSIAPSFTEPEVVSEHEEEEEIEDQSLTEFLLNNPYSIASPQASLFVPSVDEVNVIGEDLFDAAREEEDVYQ